MQWVEWIYELESTGSTATFVLHSSRLDFSGFISFKVLLDLQGEEQYVCIGQGFFDYWKQNLVSMFMKNTLKFFLHLFRCCYIRGTKQNLSKADSLISFLDFPLFEFAFRLGSFHVIAKWANSYRPLFKFWLYTWRLVYL